MLMTEDLIERDYAVLYEYLRTAAEHHNNRMLELMVHGDSIEAGREADKREHTEGLLWQVLDEYSRHHPDAKSFPRLREFRDPYANTPTLEREAA